MSKLTMAQRGQHCVAAITHLRLAHGQIALAVEQLAGTGVDRIALERVYREIQKAADSLYVEARAFARADEDEWE